VWVKQLFGRDPSLHDPEVYPPECGRALKGFQLTEGNTGPAAVHRDQQRTNGTPVQRVRPLEELDAVHSGQSEVGCHERHIIASVSQLREEVDPGLGRALGQHPVIGAVPPAQQVLEQRKLLRIVVDHQQDRICHPRSPPPLKVRLSAAAAAVTLRLATSSSPVNFPNSCSVIRLTTWAASSLTPWSRAEPRVHCQLLPMK
jgi:hypothetical protein